MFSLPQKSEYHEFYQSYIDKVENIKDILLFLESQRIELIELMQNVPAKKQDYRYEPNKWSIKEILRHIIDAEGVFAFRAFTISKNTGVQMPGMDQDEYMLGTNDESNSMERLIDEFDKQRQYHITMINNLHKDKYTLLGNANGSIISVRANIYIIAGHTEHHIDVYKERYLPNY